MKKVKKILNYIFAKMFSLFPLKKYIIFESNSDYCDNSKALYDYLISIGIEKEYKLYWIVNKFDKKYDNLILKSLSRKKLFKSIKSIYISTRAKYCFFTHAFVGNPYVKKQTRCFLMHGTSLKNLANVYGNVFEGITHAVVTSDFTAKIHSKTKKGVEGKTHILGYPRNDRLFDSLDVLDNTLQKLDIKTEKVILWMPTFKHIKGKNRNDASNMDNDLNIANDEFLNEINDVLKKNNVSLVIKLHPAQDLKYVNISNRENIFWLTNEDLLSKGVDPYSLLAISDALITDFSSVYIDYLLIDKPIGFELSNIENYKKGLGFSVDNPLDYMPGSIITNTGEFVDFINDLLQERDNFKEKREKIRNLYHVHCDGNSSKRITEFFGIGDVNK